jgi:RNA binding exosome subunit
MTLALLLNIDLGQIIFKTEDGRTKVTNSIEYIFGETFDVENIKIVYAFVPIFFSS